MRISKKNQKHIDDLTELEKREKLIDDAFDGFFSIVALIGYFYLAYLIGFKVLIIVLIQYTGYRIGRSSSK